MFDITFDIISGLVFGLEHLSPDEEHEAIEWVIVAHIAIFRICLVKLKEE